MAIVYRHRRVDNNEIFYIGIGKTNYRSIEKNNRNTYWYNITNKIDYKVEILYENLSEEDAKELEIFLIEIYGRKHLKTGSLCNLTCGGDGRLDFKHSEESKLKMKKSNKGVCNLARKNALNANNKKVIDVDTNVIYNSITEACNLLGYNRHRIYDYLSGRRKNKTTLKYLLE